MEDPAGLAATEDIVEVGDQVGMVDIMVAIEGIIGGVEGIVGIMVAMVGIMVVMVASFPDYLSAVS